MFFDYLFVNNIYDYNCNEYFAVGYYGHLNGVCKTIVCYTHLLYRWDYVQLNV